MPETWEPTLTVVTAVSVPVVATLWTTVPRSANAVRNADCFASPRPNTAHAAAARATTAATVTTIRTLLLTRASWAHEAHDNRAANLRVSTIRQVASQGLRLFCDVDPGAGLPRARRAGDWLEFEDDTTGVVVLARRRAHRGRHGARGRARRAGGPEPHAAVLDRLHRRGRRRAGAARPVVAAQRAARARADGRDLDPVVASVRASTTGPGSGPAPGPNCGGTTRGCRRGRGAASATPGRSPPSRRRSCCSPKLLEPAAARLAGTRRRRKGPARAAWRRSSPSARSWRRSRCCGRPCFFAADVWLAWPLLLDPVNRLMGRPSLLGDLEAGAALAAAGAARIRSRVRPAVGELEHARVGALALHGAVPRLGQALRDAGAGLPRLRPVRARRVRPVPLPARPAVPGDAPRG